MHVAMKIIKLREAQNIAIYTFSMDFGNPLIAVGYSCPGQDPDLPLELREPLRS